MAHALRLSVVAEGVETRTQRDFLDRHGCDVAQGYLYSRPVEPADVEALLRPDEILTILRIRVLGGSR